MHTITEIFTAPSTKADQLFWRPAHIDLARSIHKKYTRDGDLSGHRRYVDRCAARWGISRRCAHAILTGEGTFEITDKNIIITRPVVEA